MTVIVEQEYPNKKNVSETFPFPRNEDNRM